MDINQVNQVMDSNYHMILTATLIYTKKERELGFSSL